MKSAIEKEKEMEMEREKKKIALKITQTKWANLSQIILQPNSESSLLELMTKNDNADLTSCMEMLGYVRKQHSIYYDFQSQNIIEDCLDLNEDTE